MHVFSTPESAADFRSLRTLIMCSSVYKHNLNLQTSFSDVLFVMYIHQTSFIAQHTNYCNSSLKKDYHIFSMYSINHFRTIDEMRTLFFKILVNIVCRIRPYVHIYFHIASCVSVYTEILFGKK